MNTLLGPFREILTMNGLSEKGPLNDGQMEIIPDGGVIKSDGTIIEYGSFLELKNTRQVIIEEIEGDYVLLPGFIDPHTHMCFAGSRAGEYALKIEGLTYQELLQQGGGIFNTVKSTREATAGKLIDLTRQRLMRHINEGVTTVEIKSGYGLTFDDEMKMLKVIAQLNQDLDIDIISTCLAAHVRPPEFSSNEKYLDFLSAELLPDVIDSRLSDRVDIFIEDNVFTGQEASRYLIKARQLGFKITVHADQFSTGGSEIAAQLKALSADHLEVIPEKNMRKLADNDVSATVLPGASMGLGMPFAPARKILDSGCSLAIATDWNPGSAPMGDLLTQASLLSASEKLTTAETFSAITFRAARAIALKDRGRIASGQLADMVAFNTEDYREILYHQGKMTPEKIWKNGKRIKNKISS